MVDKVIKVDVKSNLKEETQSAKAYNKELDKAKSASRTGSRAADAALGFSETGLRRGATGPGGRGGDSRDFARQAQGLGGLVHIYATFAANLFAVSAAFMALQKAADTSMMIKSAEALSSRYGVALKGVAQGIREVTEGAISMREAIEFSNLGGAAGLTTSQMQGLATVAKSASAALGRDLADSMNRVYKGAIKIEPELLDELGIMVKVDQATKEYARSLGKTALELTDYERRQAFVNAVTQQGLEKYKDIGSTVNVYSKLLASLGNLRDSGLGVVNDFLKPFIEALSSSPTALIGAVTAIIAKLAKMALPSLIPDMQGRVDKAAEELVAASEKFKLASQAVRSSWENTEALQFISNDTTSLSKSAKELSNKLKDALERDIAGAEGIGPIKLGLDTEKIRNDYLDALTKALRNTEALEKRSNLGAESRARAAQRKAALVEEIKLVKNLEKGFSELSNSEKISAKERLDYNMAIERSMRAQGEQKALTLLRDGRIIASLRTIWETEKAITAEKIKQANLSGVSKTVAEVQGAVTGVVAVGKAAGTILTSIVARLTGIGMAVSILATGFTMLGGVAKYFGLMAGDVGKVSEKTEQLNTQVEALNKSYKDLADAKSLNDVFELKLGNLRLVNDAVAGIKDLAKAFRETSQSATWLDKFIDSLATMIPLLDSASESFRKSFGSAVGSTSSSLGPQEQLKFIQELKKINGTELFGAGQLQSLVGASAPTNDIESARISVGIAKYLEEALFRAGGNTDYDAEKRLAMVNQVVNLLEEIGKESARTAGLMEQAKSATIEANKVSKDYVNSMMKQTDASKLQTQINLALAGAVVNQEAFIQLISNLGSETGIIAGVKFPAAIKAAQEQILELEKDLKKYTDSTEREIARQRGVSQIIDNTLGSVVKFINDINAAASKLIDAQLERRVSAAVESREKRLISSQSSVVGYNPTMARQERSLERASRDAAIREAEAQLAVVQNSFNETMQKVLGEGASESKVAEILSGGISIESLGEDVTKRTAEINGLREAYNQLQAAKVAATEVRLGTRTDFELELEEKRNLASGRAFELTQLDKLRSLNRELNSLLGPQVSGVELINNVRETTVSTDAELLRLQMEMVNAIDNATLAQMAGNKNAEERYLAEANILGRMYKQIEASKELIEANARLNDIKAELSTYQDLHTAQLELANAQLDYSNSTNSELLDAYDRRRTSLEEQASIQDSITASTLSVLQLEADKFRKAENYVEEARVLAVIKKVETEQAVRAVELAKELLEIERERRKVNLLSMEDGVVGMFSPEYWEELDAYATDFFGQKRKEAGSIGVAFVDSMSNAFESIGEEFFDLVQTGELSFETLGGFIRNTFSDVFKDLASRIMKDVIWTILERATQASGGSSGGGSGIFSTILGAIVPSVMGAFSGAGTFAKEMMANTTSDPIGSYMSYPFANGGVMTEYGPLKLEKYSRGGVATSPQLALYGEGSQNEAYVPLPDNRSIPVTLSGNQGGVTMGDTNIHITVEPGGSDVSVEENTEFAKRLSMAVKATVNEELIRQSRPGGMFYKR